MSTISSRSNYRFRTHRSYSKTETQQETIRFSIEDINKATSNFASENRIGQGGFGAIYKGKLKDGTLIAVKRARKVSSHLLTLLAKIHTSSSNDSVHSSLLLLSLPSRNSYA